MTAFGLKLTEDGHDLGIDGVVEGNAILGAVIEAAAGAKGVLEVVGKTGVAGHLLAELEEFLEDFLAFVSDLETAIGNEFPRFLAKGAVCLFEVTAHLDESFFFAAKIHGERTHELLVALAELGFLSFERDVFFAEKFDEKLRVTVENEVAIFGQLSAERMGEINLAELELARFEFGFDVFDKMEVGPFGFRAIGVTAHGDVTTSGFLVERRAEFAAVEEPLFEGLRSGALRGAGFELIEEGRDF